MWSTPFFSTLSIARTFFLGWVITLFFIDTMVLKVKALKRAVPILQFFGGVLLASPKILRRFKVKIGRLYKKFIDVM